MAKERKYIYISNLSKTTTIFVDLGQSRTRMIVFVTNFHRLALFQVLTSFYSWSSRFTWECARNHKTRNNPSCNSRCFKTSSIQTFARKIQMFLFNASCDYTFVLVFVLRESLFTFAYEFTRVTAFYTE